MQFKRSGRWRKPTMVKYPMYVPFPSVRYLVAVGPLRISWERKERTTVMRKWGDLEVYLFRGRIRGWVWDQMWLGSSRHVDAGPFRFVFKNAR